MTISSRTPEGVPHRCPVCGALAAVEPSYPGGDACCPACGQLLWWFRDRIATQAGRDQINLDDSFASLGLSSLDWVELVMELEEQYDIDIPDAQAERMESLQDAIRYIRRRMDEGTHEE